MSVRSSEGSFINASNPNPQFGKHRYPRNNKYVIGFHNLKQPGSARSKKNSCSSNRENKIPYPFLSSFLGNGDYYKPSKRLYFGKRLTSEDVLNEQLRQIRDHNEHMIKIKNYEHQEDKKYIENFVKTIKKEDFKKKADHSKLVTEFKEFNDKSIMNNMKNMDNVKHMNKTAENNFFPFTHGDKIESIRATQKEKARLELKEKLLTRSK